MRLSDRLVTVSIILLVVAGVVAFLASLPSWIWHPLAPQVCKATYHTAAQIRDCKSYNVWSGINGSVVTSLPPWIVALVIWIGHVNCHTPWCWRRGKYPTADGKFKLCHVCHPDLLGKKPTLDLMHEHHHAAKAKA